MDEAVAQGPVEAHAWWQSGVIYQIYPRSFQDSDGDGIGDLEGIRQRLDYLVALGVDAIWISPVYPSPMADFGYDISDYRGVDPVFGTLEAFDDLVAACHGAGLRVILDFVPSHSSDRHPWFQASRSGRDDPMRDWYIWRDPAPDGGPPTNWISEFGGSAWTWDAGTGQYYLSLYAPEQPALNWRNPETRAEMLDVLRFWFDRGVDGFRVDAIENVAPNPDLGDHPENPDFRPGMAPNFQHAKVHAAHTPEVFRIVPQMREVADAYPGRVMIGEAYASGPQLAAYYGEALDGFQLPFNFDLLYAEWRAEVVARLVEEYEAVLPEGAWPNWVLGNHDRARIATRVGPAQARVAAMLLLTLRGTPTIYQGDELGMENIDVPEELIRDPWAHRAGAAFGRDPVRAPMRWTDAPGGGFSGGAPWLPPWQGPGAAAQADDPGSILSLYRALLALRRRESALSVGSYRTLAAEGDLFLYAREAAGRRLVLALNFGGGQVTLPVAGRVLAATGAGRGFEAPAETLGPDEGLVLEPI